MMQEYLQILQRTQASLKEISPCFRKREAEGRGEGRGRRRKRKRRRRKEKGVDARETREELCEDNLHRAPHHSMLPWSGQPCTDMQTQA